MRRIFQKFIPSLLGSTGKAQIPANRQGLSLTTDEFQLDLAADWRLMPADDPQQWCCISKAKRSNALVSVMLAAIPKAMLPDAARAVAEKRRNAELEIRSDRNVRFGDSWVELTDDGEIGHVAYAGYDDHVIFRSMSWVTQTKILNLTVETATRDNEVAKSVFEEVFGGFRFHLP